MNAAQVNAIRTFWSKPLVVRALLVAGAVIVSVVLLLPFFVWRYEFGGGTKMALRLLNTHDLASIVAIMDQFDVVLRSGVLYPRWLPDINYGYGVATMVFYPPGLFYLSSLVHAVVKDWVATVLVIAATSTALSGLTLYRLSRVFHGRLASTIGALFYIVIPYHAVDLYLRGALPEFVCFALLPAVLYFAYRLGSDGRLRDYAGLGLFFGIYVLTHLPVGYLLSYALSLYAVLWAIRERDLRIALRIAGGMAIGLVLSAVYWLPAALESKYTLDIVTSLFPYHKSYVTLEQTDSPFDNLINVVFTFQTLALFACLAVLRYVTRASSNSFPESSESSGNRMWWSRLSNARAFPTTPVEQQTRLWRIMALVATFMCTSFSIYVSRLIPKIQLAVPAFRWLAISSVFLSLLVAAAVERLTRSAGIGSRKAWALRLALALVIALNLGLTAASVIPSALANGTYVRSDNIVLVGFIPNGAAEPDSLPRMPEVIAVPQGGVVETTRWDPQHRQIAVRVDQPSELRLRTYFFPGWTARIDGQRGELSRDEMGIQRLSVPEGRHLVDVEFVDTAPRVVGKVLFSIGLAMIVGLAVAGYIRTRRARASSVLATDDDVLRTVKLSIMAHPRIVSFCLAVVLIGSLAVLAIKWLGARSEKGRANRASETTRTGTGDRLFLAGWDSIPVAVNEGDLDELIRAIAAKDNDRIGELVRTGKVFRARPNSRVRILQRVYGKLNIRIVEGQDITLEGWIPERWIN